MFNSEFEFLTKQIRHEIPFDMISKDHENTELQHILRKISPEM